MFVELVDRLRCVRPHEEAWLVLASRRTVARHVVDGVLGCPVCRAEYPVRDGVADFRPDAAGPGVDAAAGAEPLPPADPDELLRLAALLALVDVRAPVVLAGTWEPLAAPLADAVPGLYLVVNPSRPVPAREEVSAIRASGALPLADGAAHGAALDDAAAADPGLVAGAVRALRPRGRLVAPVALPLPEGVRELARDERHWVAERDAAPASRPVTLRRA